VSKLGYTTVRQHKRRKAPRNPDGTFRSPGGKRSPATPKLPKAPKAPKLPKPRRGQLSLL
jgi:hypothetical protein